MTDIIFLVLLLIHIVTIVLWMGASVLMVSVLGPGISKLQNASKADFFKTIGPRFVNYVIRNATVAIVVGLILYAYILGYIVPVSAELAPSQSGMPWIQIGVIFGLAAYVIGLVVVVRSNRKLFKVMSNLPSDQSGSTGPGIEVQALQRRIAMGSGLTALLLSLALLSMVFGANL